jgi:hypothetical protein
MAVARITDLCGSMLMSVMKQTIEMVMVMVMVKTSPTLLARYSPALASTDDSRREMHP